VRLPRLLAGGAAVAVVAGTAACGAQALEPKIALRDAMSDFTAGRTGALEVSIPSSAEDVRAFSKAADPSSGGDIRDEDLQTMLGSSVELAYDLGKDRKDDADDKSSVVLKLGDLQAGELRTVDGLLYARVDVDGLAEKFPDMQDGLDQFRADLSGEDGVSEPAPAEVVEPATALLDGEWVSLDPQAYLDQLQAGAPGGDAAGTGLSDYTSPEVRDLLGAALKDAVTSIERRESDQIGDHLVAKVDLRKGYATLRSGLPDLVEGGQSDVLEQQMPPVSEVPDRQIDVSFWLRDGKLKRAELDVAQFLPKPAGHLVLRADVGAERKITAPSSAVEFDVAAVTAAGMAYGAAEDETVLGGGAEVDARTMATWVDQDIAYTAHEKGGSPSVSYLPELLPAYEGMTPGLVVTAVGDRVQVAIDKDVVCLTLSADGTGEDIADGPC
jgi:hypothetical protein